jgi:hypothetical protein
MKRLLLILCLLGSARPCLAGTFTQNKGAASLEVSYDKETRKLALADLITVTLTVEGSASMRTPVAPLELAPAAPWVLVERSKFVRETIHVSRVRYRLIYRFAPREPGTKVPFHFPDVKFKDGEEAEQTLTWVPISFEVQTHVAAPDLAAMRDITAIEELPTIELADQSWQLWSALAVSCLLLIAIVYALRVFLARNPPRSPAQLALYEWQRLIALKLPERGRSERFITLLTMLVRQYLERQFALPARRQTTPEFMQNLDRFPMLTAPEKQFLTTFLQRCDAVKFARAAMTPEECAQWAEAARQFLEIRVRAGSVSDGFSDEHRR